MYSTFEHTADVGLNVSAEDLDTLFSEAARGLVSILVDDPAQIRPIQEFTIEVEGTDLEYLLFDWLNELLFRFETEQLLLSDCDVNVNQRGLKAQARGETFQPERHKLAHEIKAITYHQLEVKQTSNGWQARFIVDI
ncbi:MAG: archease [Planctomycetaceae bacterium]|nr:archease [Planctomycetaceae bacterium]